MKEGVLIELPGTVGINVGKRALGGGGEQPQMTEFAADDGQPVADLSQALRLSQLTEEHGDILVYEEKPLAWSVRLARETGCVSLTSSAK